MKSIISIVLTLILISVSYSSDADYTYNKPNITLLDKDKQPVSDIPKSTSSARCLQKASNLPAGTYYCRQPDITVTVTNNVQETNQATLSWTAPTENTDNSELTNLAGFKVYYGLSADSLTNTIDVNDPLARQLPINGLASNTYFFAVTAIDSLGRESELSKIVNKVLN